MTSRSEPLDEDPPLRVTTLELFFDLVFVFTITQLTSLLTKSPLQVVLIFGVLWWMYGGYVWLTNTRSPARTPERILLLLGMAGFLIIGLTIPRAFSSRADGIALGLGYLLVILVHAGLYLRVNENFQSVLPFNLLSATLVTIAGLVPLDAAYGLWAAALALQALSPLIVHPHGKFPLEPSHLVERHGALIIVVFGESVADVGFGIPHRPITVLLVVSATLGLALTAALWWAFFGTGDDDQAEAAMRACHPDDRAPLALKAFFYSYIPMLLGVVAAATALKEATGSPDNALAFTPAFDLAGGVALFLVGQVLFRHFLGIGSQRLRLISAAACVAVGWPVAHLWTSSAAIALLTVIIGVTLAVERKRSGRPATLDA